MRKHLQQPQHCDNRRSLPGFATLIAVLIAGSVAVAVVTSLLLLGVGSLQSSLTIERSGLARDYANACAEETIQRLSEDDTYAAGLEITFSGGTCEVIAISGSGSLNRVVQVEGIVSSVVRRVEVDMAQIQPSVILNSWQEVAQF